MQRDEEQLVDFERLKQLVSERAIHHSLSTE